MNQSKALITQIIMTLFPQQPKWPWQHSGGIYLSKHTLVQQSLVHGHVLFCHVHIQNVWLRSIGIDHAAWATPCCTHSLQGKQSRSLECLYMFKFKNRIKDCHTSITELYIDWKSQDVQSVMCKWGSYTGLLCCAVTIWIWLRILMSVVFT